MLSGGADAAIAQAGQAGRAAWPGVQHPQADFARWVVEQNIDLTALQAHGADLFLASACATGEAAAIAAFESRFVPGIRSAAARVSLPADMLDELEQSLRVRLLAGPSPRIALYRGAGPLGAWVRVTASRLALELKQAAGRQPDGDWQVVEALAASGADPELAAAREQHRETFQAELERCFVDLPPRERALLRMHFLHRMGLDQIASVLKVHRVTVSRWMAAARRRIFTRLCARLSLHVDRSSEMASLIRLLRSDIEVSIHRLLDGPDDEGRSATAGEIQIQGGASRSSGSQSNS
jgi:RNA polymerase sigma-70 factor (ECF subfamily)